MKTEKMIWGGVGKNTYTAPEMNVYELSADTGIMQASVGGTNDLTNYPIDWQNSDWTEI